MVMNEWTDIEDIVSRAQRGDRQAYGDLFEAFWPSIYAMALSRLRDVDEAQDLAQDVWVHAYMKLGQLRQPAAFAGWLRQITARMVINRVSRRHPSDPLRRLPQHTDRRPRSLLATLTRQRPRIAWVLVEGIVGDRSCCPNDADLSWEAAFGYVPLDLCGNHTTHR